jgi:hypothetical protein
LHLGYLLLNVIKAVENTVVTIVETHRESIGAIASPDNLGSLNVVF